MTFTGSAGLTGAADDAAAGLADAAEPEDATSALPQALVSIIKKAVMVSTEILMFTEFICLFLSLFLVKFMEICVGSEPKQSSQHEFNL